MINIDEKAIKTFELANNKYKDHFNSDLPIQNWKGWQVAGTITEKDAVKLLSDVLNMIDNNKPLPPLDENVIY